ncbi:MAG: tetratricopeptide repeat protein [Bacteroidales bacterium]|jgi:outer membrane protein assembly factor BamD (BamD/ComL family)|nr:tetratricopeptide repeat protein [Bacteroidales bacterium]
MVINRILKRFLGGIFFVILTANLYAQQVSEQLAYQYFRDGEFEKAAATFEELHKQFPENVNIYVFYIRSLLQSGQFKDAEKVAQRQYKKYPAVLRYGIDYGYVLETVGETAKAQKQYEETILGLKNNNVAVHELANTFRSYNLLDYALKTYQQGRKLSNQQNIYCAEIAGIYEVLKNYKAAMSEYLNLLSFNDKMLEFVQSRLLNWLAGEDEATCSEIIRTSTLKAMGKEPDKIVYESLLIWYSMQKKDFMGAIKLAKAMDKRYKTGGQEVYKLALIAAQNLDYTAAEDACNYILSLSVGDWHSPYRQQAELLLLSVRLDEAIAAYPTDNAVNKQIDKDIETYIADQTLNGNNFALYRKWLWFKSAFLNQMDVSKTLINKRLEENTLPIREKSMLKIDLGDILQLEDDVWEATLLYSQVEKDFPNDTLGQYAKFKNAKLSFHIGEFEWAKAQLDVLRAATSKLIANDAMYFSLLIFDNTDDEDSVNVALKQFAKADFLMECHRWDEASIMLDSVEKQALYHSLLDDVLYRKAHIAVAQQQYWKADSLYNQLITNYAYDLLADDALFERAKLHEIYLKDPLQAMDLYQKLLITYPESIYAADARKNFRILRGDTMQ